MNEETVKAVKEFCVLFPTTKSDINGANDLRRITNIGYYAYRHNENIDEIKQYVLSNLKNVSKEQIADQVAKRLPNLREVMCELDNLHLLK